MLHIAYLHRVVYFSCYLVCNLCDRNYIANRLSVVGANVAFVHTCHKKYKIFIAEKPSCLSVIS